MTKADEAVDRAADKLEDTAHKAAARGGVAARLAGELSQDAAFLRKLKPSLMVARAKGEAPTDERPGSGVTAPSGPQVRTTATSRGGPNPFLVLAAAFAAGVLLAKLIDWRGHAHPRG